MLTLMRAEYEAAEGKLDQSLKTLTDCPVAIAEELATLAGGLARFPCAASCRKECRRR